jgi:outer membrane receptor protein involved in Fe transport
VSNDDYRATVAAARTGYAGRRMQARGSMRHLQGERGYPGPYGSDPNGTFPGVDRISRGSTRSTDGALAITVALTDRVQVRSDGSLADFDSDFASPYGRSIGETRRATGRVLVDASPGSLFSFSAGAEVLHEQATSTYITGLGDGLVPVSRRNAGLFAEGRLTSGRVQLTGGLRIDDIRRDAIEASLDPFLPRPAFAADSVVAVSPRLSAGWFVVPAESSSRAWTRLRASAGTGIRPPDAFEIAFTDNPSLEPERSRSIEVGIEQGLLGGAFVVDATAFHNEYDNLIVAVGRSFVDASRFRTDNIANARSRGIELSLWSRWRAGLGVRASYAWLDTLVLAVDGAPGQAPPPFEPGDPLIRRPRHAAWLLTTVARERWNAFARVGARGRVTDVDPTFGAFGGLVDGSAFAVLDAGGAIRLPLGLEVFGRVGNVLDTAYEEVVGYPGLGRHVMIGARVAAGR